MIKEYVMHMHLGVFQTASLVLFAVVYITAFAWTFRKNSKTIYAKISSDILKDLPQPGETNGKR